MNKLSLPIHNGTPRNLATVLLEFLGSMYLAVTLLIALAVASVIGTVLLQNQGYNEYRVRFGDFWFEVFRTLGLYDVYTTGWFLFILGFLVVSTSVCLYRNAPHMLRDMRNYRINAHEKSLRAFHHKSEYLTTRTLPDVQDRLVSFLHDKGYRFRLKQDGDRVLIAAMKGASNRMGYIFTHAAIVIICLGGLIDGNVGLKWKVNTGQVKILHEDMRVDQVPAASRLAPGDSLSFRGNRTIPEGATVNAVLLDIQDGYVLQDLPFAIEVKDFRIEYYPTGQPKSFESDLVIHDDALPQPMERTIAVNHPLLYRGYAIYQASFGDGGSQLDIKAWPLLRHDEPKTLHGEVFGQQELGSAAGPLTVELNDFRMFNINPEEPGAKKKFRNWGPSFNFKLRNVAGEANEYTNYMLPVEREGRLYFMSGVRKSLEDDFRYLRIPADKNNSITRFMTLNQLLRDPVYIQNLVRESAKQTFAHVDASNADMQAKLESSLTTMLGDFARGGLDAIISHVPAGLSQEQMASARSTLVSALRNIVAQVYLEVLRREGVDVSQGVQDAADRQFFEDAFDALSVLPNYASPFYLQLENFKHIEATGLQITRSPGKTLVYTGCVLLILGIFIMFYIRHTRMWFNLRSEPGQTSVLMAAAGNRNSIDFDQAFESLQQEVAHRISTPSQA
jgi:cytochrome c biogenesis protein